MRRAPDAKRSSDVLFAEALGVGGFEEPGEGAPVSGGGLPEGVEWVNSAARFALSFPAL
jgi:hypothetical protein